MVRLIGTVVMALFVIGLGDFPRRQPRGRRTQRGVYRGKWRGHRAELVDPLADNTAAGWAVGRRGAGSFGAIINACGSRLHSPEASRNLSAMLDSAEHGETIMVTRAVDGRY